MNVRDLIAQLEQLDPEALVVWEDDYGHLRMVDESFASATKTLRAEDLLYGKPQDVQGLGANTQLLVV